MNVALIQNVANSQISRKIEKAHTIFLSFFID